MRRKSTLKRKNSLRRKMQSTARKNLLDQRTKIKKIKTKKRVLKKRHPWSTKNVNIIDLLRAG